MKLMAKAGGPRIVMSRIIYKKVLTVLPSALAGMGGA